MWLINTEFTVNPVFFILKNLNLIAEYYISCSHSRNLLGNIYYLFIWYQYFLVISILNPKWEILNTSSVIPVKWTITSIHSHLSSFALSSACLFYLINTTDNLSSLVFCRTHLKNTRAGLATKLLWNSGTARNFHNYTVLKWSQTIATDAAKSRLKIILKCELLNQLSSPNFIHCFYQWGILLFC